MLRRNRVASIINAGVCWVAVWASTGVAQEKPKGPERWESAIQAFEAQDKQSPPAPQSVLFVGSSSIRLWKLDAYTDLPAINRGFGGSQIADSIHFADRIVLPYQPRAIVMYAGDNDLAAKKSPDQVAADFRTFCQLVHNKLPECQILFVAIKPSISRWKLIEQVRSANDRIAAYCAKQKYATFVDIATPMLNAEGTPRPELFVKDGLHMSPQGYAVWEKALQPYLMPAK